MLGKRNAIKIFTLLSALGLFAHPAEAHGGWGRPHHSRYYIHDHYPRYGEVIFGLPHGYVSIVLGSSRYYYCDGIFYRRVSRNYIVVAPPSVVVVETPVSFQPVVVNGVTYYTKEGIYYQYTPQGYEVVPNPTGILETPRMSSQVQGLGGDIFTVNIPNSRGSFTSVVIKRSGRGFLGPQGEYYQEFPRVAQLKVMYDK